MGLRRISLQKWLRRTLLFVATSTAVILAALLVYFPGRQTPLAFTLATGIGVANLQKEVDALEAKAVRGDSFDAEDKLFLKNLYQCFAKGGRLTVTLRQSAGMMDRYLSCSGETLVTNPRIFLGSRPVQTEMTALRQQLVADSRAATLKESYASTNFYMGDPAFFESFVGLYFGQISVHGTMTMDGALLLHWRAEVPWKWPSYDSVTKSQGNPHSQSFPLPNARSLIQGPQYCLRMDDGLGQHLEELGLAKPFLVYSEWQESISATAFQDHLLTHTNMQRAGLDLAK